MTLKEAFWSDPEYVRCQWVNVGQIIFHELSGINVIYIYSNVLLNRILVPGSTFTPRTGTYLIAIANVAAFVVAIWTIQTFGRKPLLVWGHFGIAVAHALIGTFILIGFDIGIVVMICVFIFIYANSTGPIAWVYSAETCTDVGLGVCLLTLWAVVLVEVLTVPMLMNTRIETSGVFFIFAFMGLFATVFIKVFLRETKGLTDS